jgi:hypothetical protein
MMDHLRRCRACFAKREVLAIDSARRRRRALFGAHVRTQYAPLRRSRRLAAGALLNGLRCRG